MTLQSHILRNMGVQTSVPGTLPQLGDGGEFLEAAEHFLERFGSHADLTPSATLSWIWVLKKVTVAPLM